MINKIMKKISKDAPEEEKKEGVPEELPSLPEKPEKKEETAQDLPPAKEPETVPAEPPKEAAPDELPPAKEPEATPKNVAPQVKEPEKIVVQKTEEKLAPDELAPVQAKPIKKEELFFTKLLKAFEENEKQALKKFKEVDSPLKNMETEWETEKEHQEKRVVEKQIAELLNPLQELEREWRLLKEEIYMKKKLLKKKEKLIMDQTRRVQELLSDYSDEPVQKKTVKRKVKARK